MKPFIYTRQRHATPEWQWLYTRNGKTRRERRASLTSAAASYQRRFHHPLPAPTRIDRIGPAILLAYPIPATHNELVILDGKATLEPARLDTKGRDVTDLPGLWDESDSEEQEEMKQIQQLALLEV